MKHRRMAYNHKTPPGVCRLCEKPITDADGKPNNRRRWHPECVDTYRMTESGFARDKVFERDKGVCAKCGGRECGADGVPRLAAIKDRVPTVTYDHEFGHLSYCYVYFADVEPDWEHDHIIPLKDGGTFDLSNLQTLGPKCHKDKTAREAGERAKVRRLQVKHGTTTDAAPLRSTDGQRLV